MDGVLVACTTLLVTVKVAELALAGTVTLTGTVAVVLSLLESAITVLAETVALSVTVPVDLAPPVTVVGLSVTLLTVTVLPVTVMVRVKVLLFSLLSDTVLLTSAISEIVCVPEVNLAE